MLVLLIEDDDFLRNTIKEILIDFGSSVIEAPNGKVAKAIYMSQGKDIDLIFTDAQMPYLNGVEFLEWLRKENQKVPAILMSGFTNPLDDAKKEQLKVSGFLPKPFSNAQIQDCLHKIFPPQKKEEIKIKNSAEGAEYCKVLLEEFVSAKNIDYPIFIKVNSKFIRIAHTGGKLDPVQIARFKAGNLEHLWVRKSDFHKVIGFNLMLAKIATKNDSLTNQKKLNFLRHTGETILEKAFVAGIDKQDFEHAKEFVNLNLEVVCQDDEVFNILNLLQGHCDYLYAYSLGVSVYSVMLAKKLGWASALNLSKLGLCGLFHDIGKKEIDKEILEKPRHHLNPSEIKLLESHSVRGRDILMQLRHLPNEVAEVAFQHHELAHGNGYPNGLIDSEIHPFAKIIAPVARFCELVIRNSRGECLSLAEAMKKMEFSKGDYNPEVYESFVKMISAKIAA